MADVDLSASTGIRYQNNQDAVLGASNPLIDSQAELGATSEPIEVSPLGPTQPILWTNNRDIVLGASNPLVASDSELTSVGGPAAQSQTGSPIVGTIYANDQNNALGSSNTALQNGGAELGGVGVVNVDDGEGSYLNAQTPIIND